jgi:hypothetical protein
MPNKGGNLNFEQQISDCLELAILNREEKETLDKLRGMPLYTPVPFS